MPDEPVALVNINLGDGGDEAPGDKSTKSSDWGKHFSGMAANLTTIAKHVTSILGVVRDINNKLTRGIGTGTGAQNVGQSVRAAQADRLRVSKVFSVDPSKAIVPFRAKVNWSSPTMNRPPSMAALSRFQGGFMGGGRSVMEDVIDAEWSVGRTGAAPPPRGATGNPPPPRPRGTGRSSGAGRTAGRINSFRSFMGLGQVGGAAAFGLNMAGAGPAAASLGPILGAAGVGAAVYYATRLIAGAGEASLRRMSQFSPNVAGLQAQVDVTKFLTNYGTANDPAVQRAAQFNARFQAMSSIGGRQLASIAEQAKLYSGAYGSIALATAGGGLIGSLLFAYSLWKNRQEFQNAMGNANSTNQNFFGATLNGMLGDMLEIQASPLTLPSGQKLPTSVSWNNGAWHKRVRN